MNRQFIVYLAIGASLIFTGCTGKNNDLQTVTDREGNTVNIPKEVTRIISTAPSNTEILVGLGLQDKIIAIDKYSVDVEGINTDTITLDLTNPDAETIIGLEPDLIVSSGINKVGNSNNPFSILEEAGIPVIYIPTSDSIESIYEDIKCIAEATGTELEGADMISDMQEKVADISAIAEAIQKEKSVYFEISSAPSLYTGGNGTYLNEMMELIGARNIFESQEGWFSPSSEAVIIENPDVILTNVNYIEDPINEILQRDGWHGIKAVQDKAVYSIDSNTSARPSQHIVEALDEMAKAVYPEYYEE